MNCEELVQKINEIRKNKSYLTNAFFTKPQLDTLLAKAGTQILESEGLLLIIEEEIDLVRVYFYSIDNTALGKIKHLMPAFNKPAVADIVGKNPKVEYLSKTLMNKGFEEYCVFVRMICDDTKQLDDVDTSIVGYATEDDAGTIFEMLYSEFDPLYSHMPKLEEITAAIAKKEITVVRKQQQIAGFAFFEVISPRNVCWRYCIINKKYRSQGIGNMLLAHAFAYHDEGTKYMLWVGTYNSAMKKWENLNFNM